jgi:uncharacterized protein GlcG (DUF336 family)
LDAPAGEEPVGGDEESIGPVAQECGEGCFTIKVGNDVIGGVGLSGSPGVDEPCVNAGIDKVKDQLQ